MPAARHNGTELEARVHRVSLAQGVYAERNLFPAASSDHRLLATDIDVLCTEYHSNFHATRSNYECKSGKTRVLDRVLWSVGVRTLLGADASYLVVKGADNDAVLFARALGVEIVKIDDLTSLEASLGIAPDGWPARSNYQIFDEANSKWREQYQAENPSDSWRTLREAIAFLNVDGWLEFRYRSVNRLFRHFREVAQVSRAGPGNDELLCSRYVLASLAVRLSQYLLGISQDVAGIEPTEHADYIRTKLVFGDNQPEHARGIIHGTMKLVEEGLRVKDPNSRLNVDAERLMTPPPFADDLVRLVSEVRASPNAARFLPLAMEIHLFDDGRARAKFAPVDHATRQCDNLVGLVSGFIIRSFDVSASISCSCCDAITAYCL